MAVMRDSRRAVADPPPQQTQRTDADTRGRTVNGRRVWEWTKSLLIAFGLFLGIRTFLVEAFTIPTGSMENTLLVGDFLLVNKAVFGAAVPFTRLRTPALRQPERGDVVVFIPSHEPGTNYVKRLIGMPGDTLAMYDRTLYINGRPQSEPYARSDDRRDGFAPGMSWQCAFRPAGTEASPCQPTRDSWGPLVVPTDNVFVLGDNRDDSEDSRFWGFVERESIRGRPFVVYYSFNPASPRRVPWLTDIRWGSIGQRVH